MYNYIRRSIYKRGPGSGGVDVWGEGGRLGGSEGQFEGGGRGGHCYFYFLRNLFLLVM